MNNENKITITVEMSSDMSSKARGNLADFFDGLAGALRDEVEIVKKTRPYPTPPDLFGKQLDEHERALRETSNGKKTTRKKAIEKAVRTRKKAAKKRATKKAAGKRKKRTTEEIKKLEDRIYSSLTAYPGQRTEELCKNLGKPTSALVLPMSNLVEQGYIRRKGNTRATKHSVTSKKRKDA